MATYVTLLNFTDKGVLHVKDTANRASHYKELAAKFGCAGKENYWTQGQYDVVSIVDAPDEASMVALAMSVGKLGQSVGKLHLESGRREKKFPTDSEMEKAVEIAKNVDGSKDGLSPAEQHADGPMS